jgi:hypothetical protein
MDLKNEKLGEIKKPSTIGGVKKGD